jgi:hypothetical protein
MSTPIRLALALVASVASVASSVPAVEAVPDAQPPAAVAAHASVDELNVDLVDLDGRVVARTTQLSTQAGQIAQAAADLKAAQQAAQAKKTTAPATKTPSVPLPPIDPNSTAPRDIARSMMLSMYGWGDDQFTCFDKIITQESNWNVYATNKSSGAYGIPQALPGSKMATAGADWQTNPATQIKWALGYVQGRYGTPCGAWSFKLAHGWY